MDDKKELKEERLRCSKCDSLFGYLRIKDGNWCCRSCGHIERVNKND